MKKSTKAGNSTKSTNSTNSTKLKLKLKQKLKNFIPKSQNELPENLKTAIDKLVTIDKKTIQATTIKNNRPTNIEINKNRAMVLLSRNEFKKFHSVHCAKTGKFIYSRTMNELSLLLNITDYTIEETKLQLSYAHGSQYHVAWLQTGFHKLKKLMYSDSVGYFVYLTGFIFETSQTPPATKYFNSVNIPSEFNTRLNLHQDKILTNQKLAYWIEQGKISETDLIEVNELCRKFVGLTKVSPQMYRRFMHALNQVEIVQNPETFKQFHDDVKTCLIWLIKKHFDNIKIKLHGKLYNLTQITQADLNSVRAKLKGKREFHQQPKVKNSKRKHTIAVQFKDFVFDEINNNIDVDEFDTDEILSDTELRQNNVYIAGRTTEGKISLTFAGREGSEATETRGRKKITDSEREAKRLKEKRTEKLFAQLNDMFSNNAPAKNTASSAEKSGKLSPEQKTTQVEKHPANKINKLSTQKPTGFQSPFTKPIETNEPSRVTVTVKKQPHSIRDKSFLPEPIDHGDKNPLSSEINKPVLKLKLKLKPKPKPKLKPKPKGE